MSSLRIDSAMRTVTPLWKSLALVALLALVAAGCARAPRTMIPTHPANDIEAVQEVRGVWLTNVDSDVLLSRQSIAEAMDYLAAHNFNVVYPVVWNKGMTLYPSAVAERTFGIRIDPVYGDRDPLAELIVEAHRVGLEVIPWFEFGFSSSYNADGGHILAAKPHWAARDREGNLLKKNNFEWMNALHPEVQQFMIDLVLEVARNYDVDGIQGDDRLPANPTEGGYDEYTVAQYRAEFGTDPPADHKDEQWVRWRAAKLTDFLARLRAQVKAVDPNLIVSMSPSYYDWALYEYLQDSYTWTNRGLVDAIHPQAYRANFGAYVSIIDDLVTNQFTPEQLPLLAPGVLMKVGPYYINGTYLLQAVEYNRANGIPGEVWFFYEGLRHENDRRAKLLSRGPYRRPAALPWRHWTAWRPGGFTMEASRTLAEGSWKSGSAHGQRILTARGGQRTLPWMTWTLDVPADAVYDVYAWIDAGETRTTAARYVVSSPDHTIETSVDQSIAENTGWTRIGQLPLTAGEGACVVVLEAPEEDRERTTVAGPVMLLVNRRASPDAAFED